MCDITSFLYKTGVITVQAVRMPCPVSQQADNMAFICSLEQEAANGLATGDGTAGLPWVSILEVCMLE